MRRFFGSQSLEGLLLVVYSRSKLMEDQKWSGMVIWLQLGSINFDLRWELFKEEVQMFSGVHFISLWQTDWNCAVSFGCCVFPARNVGDGTSCGIRIWVQKEPSFSIFQLKISIGNTRNGSPNHTIEMSESEFRSRQLAVLWEGWKLWTNKK